MQTRPARPLWTALFCLALAAPAACTKEKEKEKESEKVVQNDKAGAQPGGDQASKAPGSDEGFGDAVGTYELDPPHSFVTFRIRHVGVAYIHGLFTRVSGSFELADPPEKSEVTMEVEADSAFTGVEKRDSDIKGPDLLNAKQYPKITFKSTRVEPLGDGRYRVTGDLELHGTRKSIAIEMKHVGSGKDPWGGFRSGFEGSFTIDRTEYGIDFSEDIVAREVDLTVAVEGKKQ